jgi:hypothetical protein
MVQVNALPPEWGKSVKLVQPANFQPAADTLIQVFCLHLYCYPRAHYIPKLLDLTL